MPFNEGEEVYIMSKIQYGTVSKAFREYLEQRAQEKPRRYKNKNFEEESDLSLFSTYSSDFKKFLKNEYDINSLDEINLSVEGLKLHINEEGIIENADGENEDDDMILGMLNELMEDEKFLETIDTDGVEGISDDEINAFFNAINKFGDKDEESVSFKDILAASKKIEKGTFDKSILTPKTSTPTPTNNPTGTNTNPAPTDPPAADNALSLEGLSVSELETKKTEQEGLLSMLSSNMKNINEDKDVKELKTALDKAQGEYQTALTKTLGEEGSKEIQACITAYATAEQAIIEDYAKIADSTLKITQLNASISECMGNIQGYTASKTANSNTISSLNSKIQSLQSQQGKDPDKEANIAQQISQLQAQVAQLENENKRLEEQITAETAKQEGFETDLKNENTNYETISNEITAKQNEKKAADDKRQELEKALSEEQKAAIANAKKAYEDAKTAYTAIIDTKKQEFFADYQKAVINLNAINAAIVAAKAKEAEEKSKTTAKENEDGSVTLTFPSDSPYSYDIEKGTVTAEAEEEGHKTKTVKFEDGTVLKYVLDENGKWNVVYDSYKLNQTPSAKSGSDASATQTTEETLVQGTVQQFIESTINSVVGFVQSVPSSLPDSEDKPEVLVYKDKDEIQA